ncbi:hypothetical protein FQA47_016964 [Oryzias melastigma]|uniref:Uncharacterized protein n=1 Tax=Oryzias melastigma TaxID=30732 RepID=A0A834L1J4_ORYME|nr:hypothetical protein FQA47_016964 [Oryzias melastigma]
MWVTPPVSTWVPKIVLYRFKLKVFSTIHLLRWHLKKTELKKVGSSLCHHLGTKVVVYIFKVKVSSTIDLLGHRLKILSKKRVAHPFSTWVPKVVLYRSKLKVSSTIFLLRCRLVKTVPKRGGSSPCQHLSTRGSLIQTQSQDFQFHRSVLTLSKKTAPKKSGS